jgi:hypothetical protein
MTLVTERIMDQVRTANALEKTYSGNSTEDQQGRQKCQQIKDIAMKILDSYHQMFMNISRNIRG